MKGVSNSPVVPMMVATPVPASRVNRQTESPS